MNNFIYILGSFESCDLIPKGKCLKFIIIIYLFLFRVYCENENSSLRLSCLTALSYVLDYFTFCIGPVLPYLVEEISVHHPFKKG